MKILFIFLALLFLSGCSYLKQGSAAVVDGAGYYCENNPTQVGREAVRTGLHNELVAEDVEICLGCPGDDKTYCVGPVKTKVDDPNSP